MAKAREHTHAAHRTDTSSPHDTVTPSCPHLVSGERDDDVGVPAALQLLDPALGAVEAVLVGDVVHHDGRRRAAVVHGRQRPVPKWGARTRASAQKAKHTGKKIAFGERAGSRAYDYECDSVQHYVIHPVFDRERKKMLNDIEPPAHSSQRAEVRKVVRPRGRINVFTVAQADHLQISATGKPKGSKCFFEMLLSERC